MLKKKKTTASGKLVLVKSVRRHWTSGGCPFSADRSGTETAQPQNEILCSKGLGGAALNKQAERKITEGFSSRGPVCINTGIACRLYQEFTIQPVIRNSELSGVLNRKPKISRKIVLFFLITFKDFPIPSKNS